jgi:hypothetical protein
LSNPLGKEGLGDRLALFTPDEHLPLETFQRALNP